MTLSPQVQAQLESGAIKVVPLVKIDLPGKTVAYSYGGRDLDYAGVTYKATKWLQADSFEGSLGNNISSRTLVFSGVEQSGAVDDVIANVTDYNYLNAPVTLSYICGVPETDEVLGLLKTDVYEIDDLYFDTSKENEGKRELILSIEIEPLGRRVRNRTFAKRSHDEQQYDNLATDTAYKRAATNAEISEEWGQITS